MARHFIPVPQAQRVNWLTAFNTTLQANVAALHIPPSLAAQLNDAHANLMSAWAIVQLPETRTTPAINAKDHALADCVAIARRVAGIIQSMPASIISAGQRLELGLPVHADGRTPIPAPQMAPQISIRSVSGWTVNAQLTNPGSESPNARPPRVIGATIFTFVGDAAPSNPKAWKFFANVTRSKLALTVPSTLTPGTRLWFTAYWRNPTDAAGPYATPVSTQINYGGLAVAS